jgi:hypothetical protein
MEYSKNPRVVYKSTHPKNVAQSIGTDTTNDHKISSITDILAEQNPFYEALIKMQENSRQYLKQ